MYLILKDTKGSQDGRFVTQFTAGQEVELSKDLASVALADGWAEEIKIQVDQPKKGRGRPRK